MKLKSLLILSILFLLGSSQSLNAQVLVHRLIGIANARYTSTGFGPTDSTALYYSKLRTSDIKTGIYKYDSAVVFAFNSGYHRFGKTTNTFYVNDSVVFFRQYYWADTTSQWNIYSSTHFLFNSIERDSIQNVQVDTGAGLENSQQYLYFYDANKNIKYELKNIWTGISWFPSDSTTNTYDASNNLILVLRKYFSTSVGTYVNSSEDVYNYNLSGQVTKSLHNTWNPMSGMWDITQRNVYTYDGSGNTATITYLTPDASGKLILSSKDSNAYDGSNNLVTRVNMVYDTTSKVFVNNTMYTLSYDTSNRPLVYTTQSWNGSSWTYFIGQDVQTHYYYQLYADTSTAVKDVNNAVSFNIYPVPASAFFNINLGWKTAQPFTIGIYDITGRLVQQWSEKGVKNYHKTIFTSQLSSGNYFIKVNSSAGQVTQQLNIIH